jgi:hypothetical protein
MTDLSIETTADRLPGYLARPATDARGRAWSASTAQVA